MTTDKKPSFILSMRFLLSVLIFFGYAAQYAQKINMSVAIVCMVNNTALLEIEVLEKSKLSVDNSSIDLSKESSSTNETELAQVASEGEVCAFQAKKGSSFDGTFVWPKKIQGFILSAYFYGYLCSNLPGGIISTKIGGKRVFLLAVLIGSAFTVVLPFAARLNWIALVICRLIIGLAHGAMWPAASTMWSRWAPPAERSRLIAFGNAGSQIGNVIALPLGGYLCINGFDGGWPSIFYIFGGFGLVWCIAWFFLTADKPEEHKIISDLERDYIVEETKGNISTGNRSTPWKEIFTSKACLAVFVGHFASLWGTYLFLTNIPTYMKEVLKFDVKSNGLLSAIPYVVFWLLIMISGFSSDKLIQSGKLSRKNVRRLYNILGFLIPAAAVVALSFVTCANPYVGVVFLTIGLGFLGCSYGAGFLVNYNDIGGSYAGLIFGISNSIASIPGFVVPYLVGVITKHQKREEWQIVFIITAVVYMIGLVVLLIFGSAKPEPWAVNQTKSASDERKEEEMVPLKDTKAINA